MKKLLRKQSRLTKIKHQFGEKKANLTGVCEGIAAYVGTRPRYIRLGFIGLAIFQPWIAIPGYIALAFLLPDQDVSQGSPWQEWMQGKNNPNIIQHTLKSDPKEISYIICSSCQTAVEQDSKFCQECGNKV